MSKVKRNKNILSQLHIQCFKNRKDFIFVVFVSIVFISFLKSK